MTDCLKSIPKKAIVSLLYSRLSHGNDTVIVTAGQVYDKLQLSSRISLSVSPDWSFYWRSFTRLAPRDIFGPVLYHVSLPWRLSYITPQPGLFILKSRCCLCKCTALVCLMAVLYRRNKHACMCLCLMIASLPSWCPVCSNTFISVLPKAVPDGMQSSNALQAEETQARFHRRDDAYLERISLQLQFFLADWSNNNSRWFKGNKIMNGYIYFRDNSDFLYCFHISSCLLLIIGFAELLFSMEGMPLASF